MISMVEAMTHLEGGKEGPCVLTSVQTKVRGGGDLDEEDDGYYSIGEEKGQVTAEMAEWGVGEAG